jgi:signal transduction histidine kinase
MLAPVAGTAAPEPLVHRATTTRKWAAERFCFGQADINYHGKGTGVSNGETAIGRAEGVRSLAAFFFQVSLLAYVMLGLLEVASPGLPVLGAAAGLNLVLTLAARSRRPGPGLAARVLSPACGIAASAALIYLSGGVQGSPFVACVWFEVVLSALTLTLPGIVLVAAGSVLAIWLQQIAFGFTGAAGLLAIQSSFLIFVGAMIGVVRRHWLRGREGLALRLREQQQRLKAIEERLQDARTLAAVGERAARLGHGLKNAVHSLRGFTSLIERKAPGSASDQAALQGLKDAIDQLESLARETLRHDPVASRPQCLKGQEVREVVERVVDEVSRCHPEVHCRVSCQQIEGTAPVPPDVVSEVLSNLLRNAVEAMGGRGEVTVQVGSLGGRWEIQVTDHGAGIAPNMAERIFRPGHTSKATGHGMGLYVARQLIESHGGDISVISNSSGASFRLVLPETAEA